MTYSSGSLRLISTFVQIAEWTWKTLL